MFNPLTPADVVRAIGAAAREAARGAEGMDPFARGQLMSAYSLSRHLAVEVAEYPAALREFREQAARAVEAALTELGDREVLHGLVEELRAAELAPAVGSAVSRILEHLRSSTRPEAEKVRRDLRSALRRLVDEEVALLAAAVEGGGSR